MTFYKRLLPKSLKFLRVALKHLWRMNIYSFKMGLAMTVGTFEVLGFFIRQQMLGNNLPNYVQVNEMLHRGGQPSEEGLEQLIQKGVRTIVTLRTDCDDDFIRERFGEKLKTEHIPFNPLQPSEEYIIKFLKLMKSTKEPVFIHCFHGADRTGMLCAAYRIVIEGWDKPKAIAEMKARGSHWWHQNLVEFVENLNVDRMQQLIA